MRKLHQGLVRRAAIENYFGNLKLFRKLRKPETLSETWNCVSQGVWTARLWGGLEGAWQGARADARADR
jgi:hypothetical protein